MAQNDSQLRLSNIVLCQREVNTFDIRTKYMCVSLLVVSRQVKIMSNCVGFCHPHPKDGETNVFSLFTTGGGGTPVPGSFPGQDGVPLPVNTCYAAGGMPLAFTQEDFLVYWVIGRQSEIFQSSEFLMVGQICVMTVTL